MHDGKSTISGWIDGKLEHFYLNQENFFMLLMMLTTTVAQL